jgi:AcrR family transcriptional regulator
MRRSERVDRRVQEFRARVLETAAELFDARGIEATKIDDICEAADVAKRTLTNHFPTKAHIVQALSREAVSRTVALIDGARVSGTTTRERLQRLFADMQSSWLEGSELHRESLAAFFEAAHGTPDASEGEIRVSDAVLALLSEGGRDELPTGCDAETFAAVVLGSIYSLTLEWVHRDGYDLDSHLARVSEFLLGLLPANGS